MSEAFQIRGGKKLHGEIIPQGAKNEALQILCAVLLTGDEVRIKNIPDIHDVNRLIEILGDFGVKITKNAHGDYSFKADDVNFEYIIINDDFNKALHDLESVINANRLKIQQQANRHQVLIEKLITTQS